MNPFFHVIMSVLHMDRRECPRCRRKQTVPDNRRRDTVVCKNCRAEIPPPHLNPDR